MENTQPGKEKSILVTVTKKGLKYRNQAQEYLKELKALADTAGAEVIEEFYQELEKPYIATMIGKGKVEELKEFIKENKITLVIFDDDLAPIQIRNLEKEWEIKVIDRSGLILDIFAKHARSLEAKTQVELAQLQYLLPRLTRMWTHLSKQYGGIGTKGPGETQIEADRRMIRIRIQNLKEKLLTIDVQKREQKKSRENVFRVALVGYTNAGKSTLMKSITEADVYIEDKLFATLDTTVRAFDLPSQQKAVLSDTVGFIRKLPTHLVASFRSTLSEAKEADVLLNVVDISDPMFNEHIEVVNKTLESLKIDVNKSILVFNKIDMLEDRMGLKSVEEQFEGSIFLSAKKNMNINKLLERLQEIFDGQAKTYDIRLDFSQMQYISKIYDLAQVLEQNDYEDHVALKVKVKAEKDNLFRNTFSKYII